MKKLLTILIFAVFCGGSVVAYDFSAVCESGQTLYYNITSNVEPYTVEVTYERLSLDDWYYSYYSTCPTGNLTIPSSVTYRNRTYSVKSIGGSSFGYCSGLTSITIPNSVTSIGDHAFDGCSGLTSVTFPNSVTSIGNYVFSGCTGLTQPVYNATCFAYFPDGYATEYTIPDGIEQVAGTAFYGCSGITSVAIPNSVTRIGDGAFSYSSNLTEINIPASVTSVGSGVFDRSGWYNSQPDGILYLDGWCVGCKGNEPEGTLNIVEGTIGIADFAFSHCYELTVLIIPNSVRSIGSGAFFECEGLASIAIPESVTTIAENAFVYCSSLETITVDNGNTIYDSRDNCNAIIETESNALILGCQNTIIPNSVTRIGHGAFAECYGLTTLTIPNSVTNIGDWAFLECLNLTGALTIPNSILTIGEGAFDACGLTSVYIGNSVNSIGDGAFEECPFIDTIYSLAVNPPVMQNFAFDRDDIIVIVPCGSVSAYNNAEYWNEFTNIQQNPDCAGVEENEIANLELYPNPIGNTLYISAEETISEIEIVNTLGQVVKRIEVNADNAVCDVEELKAGVYVVRIRTLSGVEGSATLSQRKFVKE